MRTARGLFASLGSEGYLMECALLAARGKRFRPEVAWFLFRREALVASLAEVLREGRRSPLGFELKRIRDPKPRVIARAPFQDRVVHTALVRLMEPVFLVSAMPEDYACRVGHGTSRALLAIRRLHRTHRFSLHLDIKAYFPSVDPSLLLDLVRRRVKDPPFLGVLARVLEAGAGLLDTPGSRAWLGLPDSWPPPGIGLPVGAHTSQFLATHVYLMELDHFVKRTLKFPGYVRFVDDLLLFGDSRAELVAWREQIGTWLWSNRQLRLKHPEAPVLPRGGHLDALGHRVRLDGVEVLPKALRRFRHRVALAARTDQPQGALHDSLTAGVGLILGR